SGLQRLREDPADVSAPNGPADQEVVDRTRRQEHVEREEDDAVPPPLVRAGDDIAVAQRRARAPLLVEVEPDLSGAAVEPVAAVRGAERPAHVAGVRRELPPEAEAVGAAVVTSA